MDLFHYQGHQLYLVAWYGEEKKKKKTLHFVLTENRVCVGYVHETFAAGG